MNADIGSHKHVIHGDEWHYWVYKWWKAQNHFEQRKSHRFIENGCHYLRVVLFWGPLGLFFHYPLLLGIRPFELLIWGWAIDSGLKTWRESPVDLLILLTSTAVALLISIVSILLTFFVSQRDSSEKRTLLLLSLLLWLWLPIWLFVTFWEVFFFYLVKLCDRFPYLYLVGGTAGLIVGIWAFVELLGREAAAYLFLLLIVVVTGVTICYLALKGVRKVPELVERFSPQLYGIWAASYFGPRQRHERMIDGYRVAIKRQQAAGNKPKRGLRLGLFDLLGMLWRSKVGSRICPVIVEEDKEEST